MPGFIEPHAHPAGIGAFLLTNDIVAPHEWRMPHMTYPGVRGHENFLKAANRIVANGKTMRPDERISVYEAMKGITITAARTFEMDQKIGSIKVGKDATFTLLEQNPFKIDPAKIKDIPVAGVVYRGRMVLNNGKSDRL